MSDTNAGPGMAPCRKGCRCNDCEIDRLTERNAELKAECERLDGVIQAEKERRTESDCVAIEAERRADQLQAELTEKIRLYGQLTFAVERKWPGETRHETALRYIREAENKPDHAPQQALNAPETA